ncbi:MAG: M20 family metallopeptidase, partial [Limisphaerales bacterium]
MTKTEKLLCELIALHSVNPAFVPPGDPQAGEQKVGEFLAATAARAGLDVILQPVLPRRSNVLARLSPTGKAKARVLLAPHLDTVVAAEEQFRPIRKNGRLYGRGACDTKGSVAAMITALCELARGSCRPKETEILFVGLIDEEDAQAGSRAFARSGLKADLAIVGEPTRLEVVTAHKGSLWLRLETRGKSAHGSRPELGRNAILEMAQIVTLLETQYAAQLSRKRHPLLGAATVSVGTICGGAQANIVPDQCVASVDRRTLPGETQASVRREIQSLLRRAGLNAQIGNDKHAPCLSLETNPRLPLVARFLRSAGQRRPAGVNYFCDAAVLAGAGIPSIAFG